MPSDCQNIIYSNEYYDLIIEEDSLRERTEYPCVQPLNEQYVTAYISRQSNPPLSLNNYSFASIPKCYGLSDTQALEASGIYIIQRYPGLELEGNGVLMGFIDTGIDYLNDVFKDRFNRTRIEAIWDQTIPSEKPPFDLKYGTLFTRIQIDEAIASDNPTEIVPSVDSNGHGTAMAGVAAGSDIPLADFTGAAPKCDIAVVKLKEAKQNLKDYYGINTEAPCYQENDIMAGVSFLEQLAVSLEKPLVIAIGLEGNLGDHDGNSPLGNMLSLIGRKRRRSIVVSTGNEANNAHHYMGQLAAGTSEDVEIRVDENTESFTLELWGSIPDLYSVSVISPTGEELDGISVNKRDVTRHRFVFEQTDIEAESLFSTILGGAQLIQLRFKNLTEGIWIIRVFAVNAVKSPFHMWLPIEAFLSGKAFFLASEPETTLSDMSAVESVITTASYDSRDDSIYLNSGRGYTRTGKIKPDIASPGVDVYTALPGNRYSKRSGGSIAAAICAGAVALIMEWAVVKENVPEIDSAQIKALLIRGAQSERFRTYPNREWGYGILNLYESFETLRLS